MAKRSSSKRWRLAVPLLFWLAGEAHAQPFGPRTPEFRVNAGTVADQLNPSVAGSGTSEGDFVIVWENESLVGTTDILLRRFDGSGGPIGTVFRVNTTLTGYQRNPSVAFVDGDNPSLFVVAWDSTQDGTEDIFMQRFDGPTPFGGELPVNDVTDGVQAQPVVGSNRSTSGLFEVVWSGEGLTDPAGIWGASFSGNTTTRFLVNSYTTGTQASPGKGHAPGGRHVVVWAGEGVPPDGDMDGVYAQRFDTNHVKLGGQFRVNTVTTLSQSHPAAAFALSPNPFVIVWDSNGEGTGGAREIVAQRFAFAGEPLGPPFRVNTWTSQSQDFPAVAGTDSGEFVVVWHSFGEDAGFDGIVGQHFSSSGSPLGAPFQVNTYTSNGQRYPSIAVLRDEDFVVTWQSNLQDGSGLGVYARIFCGSLTGDANGDDVVDVVDVLYLINRLFAGGPAPLRPSDVNGDGGTDVLDVLYLINNLFASGPGPRCVSQLP